MLSCAAAMALVLLKRQGSLFARIGRQGMSTRNQSPRTVRIVGDLLALVWLAAGFAAIFVAVGTARWLPGVLGVAAVCYGLLWVRVARLARQLTVREALMPWRVGRRSDP
jgi:hypothetical protein